MKITKTIERPEKEINDFADFLGYQSKIRNEDYKPAEGAEFILNEEGEQIENPDYKAQVGERTIDNPQSKVDFVSEKFDEFVVSKFFGRFFEQTAREAMQKQVSEAVKVKHDELLASITTTKDVE